MSDYLTIAGTVIDRTKIEAITPRTKEGDTLFFMASGKVVSVPQALSAEEIKKIIRREREE